jgi:hypothetical protein
MKTPKHLSMTDIADRLEQAAQTLKRLPPVKVQGYFGTWPLIMQEAMSAYGWEEARLKLGPPSARHISEMDEVLRWLMWLEREEVKLVWLRACGARWKLIGRVLGWSVRKLQYDWRIALAKIEYRLANPDEIFELPCLTRIRNG